MSVAKSWAILFVLVTLSAIWLFGQPREVSTTTELAGVAMTMPYRVVIGAKLTQYQQRAVQQIIVDSFSEIDDHYNQFNPSSEVSRLNSLFAGETVTLSPKMTHFLSLVDRCVQITDGRFDPTIEPLKKVWLPHLTKGTLPSTEELAAVAPMVGWKHVHLDHNTFSKDHNGVQLNLDAIAKGFAVDLLVYNLVQASYSSVLVDWGGEIKATGHHPEGRPWRIYISGLEGPNVDDTIAQVELEEAALATSGDYYQNWTIQEPTPTTYCHVFDPRHLTPVKVNADSVASASVMSSSCATADALATALMVFDNVQEAHSWANEMQERYPSLNFWLAQRHGKEQEADWDE